jgi:16S rRNA (guanine(966)-N(2))-methyltransferase RsmD
MRVITGRFRGRKLYAPPPSKWPGRPPLDRMKQGFFNIIQNDVYESRFLDLFAGTGSMGIEALSRYASRAVFVESHPAALESLYANLEHCRLLAPFDPRMRMRPLMPGVPKDTFEILPLDVHTALRRLEARGEEFDFVFTDPPFGYPRVTDILDSLGKGPLLSESVLVAVHHHKKAVLPESCGAVLHLWRRRAYGQSVLSFYRREDVRDTGPENAAEP